MARLGFGPAFGLVRLQLRLRLARRQPLALNIRCEVLNKVVTSEFKSLGRMLELALELGRRVMVKWGRLDGPVVSLLHARDLLQTASLHWLPPGLWLESV